MKRLTIGQLAKKIGVNIETIRYYERRKLIPEPPRKETDYFRWHQGYRQFPPETAERIRLIKRAQELGFTLKEILQLLDFVDGKKAGCNNVRSFGTKKITEIETRIQHLKEILKILKKMVNACPSRGPLSKCSIIGGLKIKT